jgi:hypothetical protein
VGLERGQLSLASTIEELLEIKRSTSALENRDYGSRGSAALTTLHNLYPNKLALTLPTSGCRSRTQATQFSLDINTVTNLVIKNFLLSHRLWAASLDTCHKGICLKTFLTTLHLIGSL